MFSVTTEQLRDESTALAAEEPLRKRQRLSAGAGTSNESSGPSTTRLPAAFHLLRTEGIADKANECVHRCWPGFSKSRKFSAHASIA